MNAGNGSSNGISLPYNVLVDILRRLPGRALARSGCVCRTWRAIVDAQKLIPPLLPLPHCFPKRVFGGIFFSKIGFWSNTSFFAPPGTHRLFFPHEAKVRQSCNGLLLLDDLDGTCVLNPETGRCSLLPSLTPWQHVDAKSLAFDPAVSLHYHVFLLQELKKPQEEAVEGPKERVLSLFVYSSRTGEQQWENRKFMSGRCAPDNLYDAVATPSKYDPTVWSSDYWRGSIYMHCHKDTLMVLRPSCGTYDMVRLPGEPGSPSSCFSLPWKSVLASYERGIHYVSIDKLQLRVWMLSESTYGQLWWTLAHDVSLNPHGHMIKPPTVRRMLTWGIVGSRGGPLKLNKDDVYDDDYYDDYNDDDDEYSDDADNVDDDEEKEEEEKEEEGDGYGYSWDSYGEEDGDGDGYSWNSDEDNFIDVDGGTAFLGPPSWGDYCMIVGFHPHKNALILIINFAVVVYHLDTSRMQYLGEESQLKRNPSQQACCVDGSFTYRPCYNDVLPVGKS